MSKKQHLSRLAAPKSWPVKRKLAKWIAKPMPGTHSLNKSIPLVVVIRDLIKLTNTSKEVRSLINSRDIFVNNKLVREIRFAVGLFDIISINKTKINYRIIINKQGKLIPVQISDSESNILPLRVENKTTISTKKTQLNFNNGWNLLVDKDDYKTNDVILFDTKTRKISNKLRLAKGSAVYLIGGKHAGIVAKFVEVKETGTLRKHRVVKVISDKVEIESSLKNIMIVGKDKPVIKLN
jgi:small subunit ribosomal protein S4e